MQLVYQQFLAAQLQAGATHAQEGVVLVRQCQMRYLLVTHVLATEARHITGNDVGGALHVLGLAPDLRFLRGFDLEQLQEDGIGTTSMRS